MVYFHNKNSDVTRAGYIFRLWDSETIDIIFFADIADYSKLGVQVTQISMITMLQSLTEIKPKSAH